MLTFLADLGGGYDLLIVVFGSLSGLLTANLLKAAQVRATYPISRRPL